MAAGQLSSPGLRLCFSPCRVRRRSPAAWRSPSRPRWARSRDNRREHHGTIGTFTRSGTTFSGTVRTLSINAKTTIKPADKASDKAPDYRIFANQVELGAAWKKTSGEGREYLSVKLDGPSFPAPDGGGSMCRKFLTSDPPRLELMPTQRAMPVLKVYEGTQAQKGLTRGVIIQGSGVGKRSAPANLASSRRRS